MGLGWDGVLRSFFLEGGSFVLWKGGGEETGRGTVIQLTLCFGLDFGVLFFSWVLFFELLNFCIGKRALINSAAYYILVLGGGLDVKLDIDLLWR